MAKTTDADTIIVVDDELHNMVWMLDYIESKNKKSKTASNVNEAIDILNHKIYRAVIIDLNIPVLDPLLSSVVSKGDLYRKYPGLYVALAARNKGYRDRQVIIYSVHKDVAVSEEATKLRCTYIVKGRPREIKEELDAVISFDPTT